MPGCAQSPLALARKCRGPWAVRDVGLAGRPLPPPWAATTPASAQFTLFAWLGSLEFKQRRKGTQRQRGEGGERSRVNVEA